MTPEVKGGWERERDDDDNYKIKMNINAFKKSVHCTHTSHTQDNDITFTWIVGFKLIFQL